MPATRATHATIFLLIVLGCLGDIITSAILVNGYKGDKPPRHSLETQTRYLLFCGVWTSVFSLFYIFGVATAPEHLIFSVASHLLWFTVTIVLFVSGSAALTSEIKGHSFPHQQRLEILQGFAWADSILLGLGFLVILGIGIGKRNGLAGNILGGP